jgi:tetratricopeptide (TPR) repeat protein
MKVLIDNTVNGLMRRKSFIILFLILASIIPYLSSLNNDFVWDDIKHISENNALRSWDNLPHLLKVEDAVNKPTGFYRPLTKVSFLLDYSIWEGQPFGYHLTNVLLHMAVTLLIFSTFRIIYEPGIGFLGAIIFALHPAQSETVLFLSGGRNTLLCSLFMLLSFQLYVKSFPKGSFSMRSYGLSLLSFLFALYSKEFAVVLPFLFLGYEYSFRPQSVGTSLKKGFLRALPYFGGIILYALTKLWALGKLIHVEAGTSLLERIVTVPNASFLFWKIILFPYGLRIYYDEELGSFPGVQWVAGTIAICVMLLFLFWSFNRQRKLFFAALWFLFPLFPVSNIIPVEGPLVAARLLYIPMVGISLLLSMLVARLWNEDRVKPVTVVLMICLLLSYTVSTISRNADWKNDSALFSRELEINSFSPGALVNLASSHLRNGDARSALDVLEPAFRQIQTPGIAILLGDIQYSQGDAQRAIIYYRDALERDGIAAAIQGDLVYNKLGLAHEKAGNLTEAARYYESAIRQNPERAEYYTNMGILLQKKGSDLKSEEYLRRSLSLNPFNEYTHNALGSLFLNRGQYRESVFHFRRAVKLAPDLCEAYYNLGTALDRFDPQTGTSAWKEYLKVCGNRESEQEWIPKIRKRVAIHRGIQ